MAGTELGSRSGRSSGNNMIGGVTQSDTAARFQSVAVVGGVINQRQNLRQMCSELAMSRSIHGRRRDATISPSNFVHAA